MAIDRKRSELELKIIQARDKLVDYFNNIPGFGATPSTVYGTNLQALADVCHPYSGGNPAISGNEWGLPWKGRKDVCLKVTFAEEIKDEENKGKVRVLVNAHLNQLIHGTPDEAERAIELHKRVREYVSGIADYHEEHGTRDAHTQLRYHLKA